MAIAHPLSTTRLTLEPVTPEHAGEAWPHLDDPRMWEFFPQLRPRTQEDLCRIYERWSRGYQESDGTQIWENWLCRRRDDGQLAGGAQATILPRRHVAYLAYSIYVEQQRRGYAREAMQAVIAHVRDVHHIATFYAEMHVRNEASYRLAESLGFRRVETVRGAERRDEPDADEYLYELAF